MLMKRRDFLKYCIGSAAALGLDFAVLGKLEQALAADGAGLPNVVWLNAANCTGCTVSLANRFAGDGPIDIADLLFNYINLAFHPNLMGGAGSLAVEQLQAATAGDFILAVDGGIPTSFGGNTCMLWTENGHEVTALEAVQALAPQAMATLCIGTCASFGGIPAGNPNPTGIRTVREVTGVSTINIPGCPTHPDWIVWTVAQLLAGVSPALDTDGRPAQLFKGESLSVHKRCPRKERSESKFFGEEGGCLKELGCKGEETQGDCPTRQWNSGTNWCVGANAICLGCTGKGFPDKLSPFYKIEYNYAQYDKAQDPPVNQDPPPDENPPPQESPPSNDGGTESTFALGVTRVEWITEGSKLMVEGYGAGRKQTVTLKNTNTGRTLGNTRSEDDGRFKFKKEGLRLAPCRILLETAGRQPLDTGYTRNPPRRCR